MKKLLVLAILAFAATAHATVTSSTKSVTYTPVVLTSAFPVTFAFDSSSDLDVVRKRISTGTSTSLTEGVDYTVTMPLGTHQGVVNTTAYFGSGWQMTITRGTALTQTSSFRTQGRYSAAVHEAALDKLTMITQELAVGTVSDTDITNAITSHEGLSNPHTGYHLTLGLAGGQRATGGTASGEDLTLRSTSHATKGSILFGASAYDEVNDRLGIGTTTPSYALEISGGAIYVDGASVNMLVDNGELKGLSDSFTALQLAAYDSTGGSTGAVIELYSPTHATKPYFAEFGNFDDWSITDSLLNELMHLTASGMTLTDVSVLTLDDSTVGGTLYGGTGAGEDITIKPNSAAANGKIFLGASSAFVESAIPQLGIGTLSPVATLQVDGDIAGVRPYATFTGTRTALAASECGGVFTTGSPSGTLELPKSDTTASGCMITFINTSMLNEIHITPDVSATIVGTCESVYFTVGGGMYVKLVGAGLGGEDGDYITVVNDASGKTWRVIGCVGIWADGP